MLVTATRFPDDAATLPFGVAVLTAEMLRASGVSTVNEAVMKLLGVPGRQDFFGGGDYTLDLRGFGTTADNNQAVIVDGIKVNEADLGGTRLAGIAIDSVERIEVIRGNAAVLYGEGATAGAIVVTTKAGAGSARANRVDLYLGAGSHNLREGRATGTVAAGGFSFDVSGNTRDTDNDRDNFRSKVDGVSGVAQWANEWLRVGIRHTEDHLDSRLPGSLTSSQYAADPRQTSTPDDVASIRNQTTGAFAQATLGGWQLALDASHRDKALDSLQSGYAYGYDIVARTWGLRARRSLAIGGSTNAFVLGYDRNDWQRVVRGDPAAVATQGGDAVYASDALTLAGGTRFSAGLRRERIDKGVTGSGVSIARDMHAWDLGLVQPLGGGFAAYGRIGRSFRLANVDEFTYTSPNTILQPQTSLDAEFGARWVHAGGRAEWRVYRSAMTHEIGFDPALVGPYGPGGANVNFDPTRRQGMELEISQQVVTNVDLRLNAATRRARFSEGAHAGADVPLTPRHTASVAADWTPATSHRLTALANWVSAQSPDFANACRMPAYVTADLRYAFRYQVAEFALGLQNLADRKYYTQAFGCSAGQTTSIYPEAGRTIVASLRLGF